MKKFDPENERLKLEYQDVLRHGEGLDPKTVDKAMTALRQFEQSTGCKSFKRFNLEQPIAFKDWLDTARNSRTGKPLSKATIGRTLDQVALRPVRENFSCARENQRWANFQSGDRAVLQ